MLVHLLMKTTGFSTNQISIRRIEIGILRLWLLNLIAVSNLLAQAVVPLQNTPVTGRQELFFDQVWRFHRGGAEGAEATFFDDSGWRAVNLPHDWSIEDLPGTDSPFDRDATSQVSGGFTVGGTGWYRTRCTSRTHRGGIVLRDRRTYPSGHLRGRRA